MISVSEHAIGLTMLALLHLWVEEDRLSVRSISDRTKLSISTTHSALRVLKIRGLVDWNDFQKATIHPTCAVVVLKSLEK